MIDLTPATDRLAALVRGIRTEQLDAPTPCADTSLGALLDHVDTLSLAFTAAAAKKTPGSGPPRRPDASRLGDDWQTRLPRQLADLAAGWQDAGAWSGMTAAGGIDMPGEVAGVVALNEVVLHGWDVAVASGQPYDADPRLVEAAFGFVQSAVAQNPGGTPGLFGPPVPVPDDASLLDRLLGLAGRDPRWQP